MGVPTKRNLDCSIAWYKARLIAKGYHQRESIDYTDTISLALKSQTINVALCLSFSLLKGWPICHMDVNNTFLNGTITGEVYMKISQGF